MVNMKKISMIALTILTLGVTSCDMDKMPYDAVPTEEAKKVFGDVEIISLGQLPQECAFITDEMTQGAFEEKLAQIGDQVLAKIRVKD